MISAVGWSSLAARSARSGIVNCAPQRIYSPPLSSFLVSSRVHPRYASGLSTDAPAAGGETPISPPQQQPILRTNKKRVTRPPHRLKSMGKGVQFYNNSGQMKGFSKAKNLPYLWLRDSCRCSQCVNQDTMQRNFNIFDLPNLDAIAPRKIETSVDGVKIIWDHESHESFYSWEFLERHTDQKRQETIQYQLWGSEIADEPPTVEYGQVMDTTSKSGIAKLTNHLMKYGLVFVNGTPFDDPVHTKRLLERIGPIRQTHYGGFYDFVPDMAKADTAYTNIALAAHTDTTYFTDPAGLQAFHMLSHTPPPGAPEGEQASGGKSLLVDGFHAAEQLKNKYPALLAPLLRPVAWHASGNKGVTIKPMTNYPIIQGSKQLHVDPKHPGTFYQIRWNNDDRAIHPLPSTEGSFDKYLQWYEAVAKWNEILKSPSSEFWFQLKPGQTLIFDNHRVLHGRSAFTGMRRICGAYINHDDFMSCWRNSNLTQEEIRAQVIGA